MITAQVAETSWGGGRGRAVLSSSRLIQMPNPFSTSKGQTCRGTAILPFFLLIEGHDPHFHGQNHKRESRQKKKKSVLSSGH